MPLRYSQLKQSLLDSVSIIAKAIIDETRSTEDAEGLRVGLGNDINNLSERNLSKESHGDTGILLLELKESAGNISENKLS